MAVTSAEITSRTPFENGNSWGKVGAYERIDGMINFCLLYTSPSPRDATLSRMPSSA